MKAETFHDPSAQMKRALFRPMAVGLVIMMLCMICALPGEAFLKSIFGLEPQRELPQVHDERDSNRIKAQEDEIVQRYLDALMAQRKLYLNSLLEPSLGSYGTAAGSLLKPFAEDVGVEISVDSADLPMRRLPLPPPPLSPQLYARKPIRLTCTGSYMRITSFLQLVEERLPLVSLEAFTLKAQKDPDNQSATIVLEWPIKGENTAAVAQGGAKK